MYDGTMAVNAAAMSPVEDFLVTSVVSKYDDIEANAEKIGARKTQTFLILIVMNKEFRNQYNIAAVSIKPGYIVPPIVRPNGNHPRSSNQFKNSKNPSWARYLVVLKLK